MSVVDPEKTSGDYSSNGSDTGALASGPAAHATEPRQSNSRSRWSNDLRAIPILSILYLLLVWDQSVISWAIYNKDQTFSTSTPKTWEGIYYLGFILFVLPTVLLLPKLGAKVVIPILAVGWGAMTMIQAGVSSWAGTAAVQFFLGMFQSGFWACVVVYLSGMYKRSELALRLALVFGLGSVLGSFNGPITYHAYYTTYSLAGWKVVALIEGAITIAMAPVGFLLLPSMNETFEMSVTVKSLMSVHTAAFTLIGLFLGAAAGACQVAMFQMSRTLDIGVLSENWQLVGMNAFGFFILMFVAVSSDFYRERSTHIGATLLSALVILVNLPLVYYINKRDPTWYSAYMIAACVYVTPIFHAWYTHNVSSLSARVGVVGMVVGAFHVGDLIGWVAFWNTTYTARTVNKTSKQTRSLVAREDLEAVDITGLQAACGFLAVAVVAIFAAGAWQKFDNRRRVRKSASNVAASHEEDVSARGMDDAEWRWID